MKLINCSKTYENKMILSHIGLTLHSGIYHLIGQNGSGKSVFCRCLLGLEHFTEGSIENLPERVLYLPETPLGEDWLTLRENLELVLFYYNISLTEEEITDAMTRLQITEPEENYHKVSLGTAMKVGLALLLQERRWDLIVLDETMSHLDSTIREFIWDVLEQRAKEGAIIILIDHSFKGRVGELWNKLLMEDINGRC